MIRHVAKVLVAAIIAAAWLVPSSALAQNDAPAAAQDETSPPDPDTKF